MIAGWSTGDWIFAAVLAVFYVTVAGYVLMLLIGAWRAARGEEKDSNQFRNRPWGT